WRSCEHEREAYALLSAVHGVCARLLLPQLLREADENTLGPADVTEAVDVFVVDDIANHRSAQFSESCKRVIQVIDRKHDAQIAQRVNRRIAMIGCDGRLVETG